MAWSHPSMLKQAPGAYSIDNDLSFYSPHSRNLLDGPRMRYPSIRIIFRSGEDSLPIRTENGTINPPNMSFALSPGARVIVSRRVLQEGFSISV
jgi:hypothetical protein